MAALALAMPAGASASAAEKIIERCGHAESLSGFTQKQYKEALKKISSTTSEYSGCEQEIREAQLAAAVAGKSRPAGTPAAPSSSAAIAATPSEQRALTKATKSGSQPVSVGGHVLHPGVVRTDIASALSTLPTPLLALLCLLLAAVLGVGGRTLHRRLGGRHLD